MLILLKLSSLTDYKLWYNKLDSLVLTKEEISYSSSSSEIELKEFQLNLAFSIKTNFLIFSYFKLLDQISSMIFETINFKFSLKSKLFEIK